MKILFCLLSLFAFTAFAEDKLAAILTPGEEWQVAAEGLSFPDGLSADADGNVYFCDLKAKPPTIFKLTPDGTKAKLAEAARSGTRVGPDGRLYACGSGKVAAYDLPSGKEEILASDGVSPNDLTVTPKGYIYFTDSGRKQITFVDPKTKTVKAADVGINKPNGIAVSPDGTTLLVSDNAGPSVYALKIGPDGALSDKKALMTMQCPEKKPGVSSGDGMTVDAPGRVYVTTALGLQVFAPTGELLGVIPKPQDKSLINACFGGKDLSYLYVACGDKVYRRKTQTKGSIALQQAVDGK